MHKRPRARQTCYGQHARYAREASTGIPTLNCSVMDTDDPPELGCGSRYRRPSKESHSLNTKVQRDPQEMVAHLRDDLPRNIDCVCLPQQIP